MFFSRCRCLGLADYRELIARCKVIEEDSFGEKVLETHDSLIVKIFRRKRLFTTATVYPYALRFIRNVRLLEERKIDTVTVLDYAYCPSLKRHLVTYRPLPGVTLRSALFAASVGSEALFAQTASLIALLHQKGVYFRSLHFGNLIVPDTEGALGLIDVADMTFRSRPLPVRLRVRNFGHLARRREDLEILGQFGWDRFVEHYLVAADMSTTSGRKLQEGVRRLIPGIDL